MSADGMAIGAASKPSEPWKASLEAMNANAPLAQPGALQTVLESLEQGHSVSKIAKSHKVTDFAVYKALVRNCPEEWMAIQAAKAHVERDKAKREIEVASDGVQVSRGRELNRIAEWTLERTCRSIYGDKLTISNEIKPEDRQLLEGASDLLKLFREKEVQAEPLDSLPKPEPST